MNTLKMRNASSHGLLAAAIIAALALACSALRAAQPALPFDLKQLSIGLPEAGAPRAVVGPYPVVTESPADSRGLQIHRPRELEKFSRSHSLPIVIWGNGACLADGTEFAGFLSTIASYGFLVVGSSPVPGNPQARITSASLIKALDWAQAQNARQASPLAGRIDTGAVAVMGMSCGGNLALEAARDPRVKTLGMWNSGVWISGEMRTGDGTLLVGTTKKDLALIHGPTLYINGDSIDPAMINAADDVAHLDQVPVFFGSRHGSGHAGTYKHANGGEFANIAVAWLRWQLQGDSKSAQLFSGPHCALCKNPDWSVQQKGL